MKFKNFSRKLLSNKKGQGATEYILLLVVIVGLVMAFKPKIKAAFDAQMGKVEGGMGQIDTN